MFWFNWIPSRLLLRLQDLATKPQLIHHILQVKPLNAFNLFQDNASFLYPLKWTIIVLFSLLKTAEMLKPSTISNSQDGAPRFI